MTGHINALDIRRRLRRDDWAVPFEFGPDGWRFDHKREPMRIIVTYGPTPDPADGDWLHASISHRERMPTYEELVLLHGAVWKGDGYAYQVFAPRSQHVNIAEHALHLWGTLLGRPVLPEFGRNGTI